MQGHVKAAPQAQEIVAPPRHVKAASKEKEIVAQKRKIGCVEGEVALRPEEK